MRRYLMLSPYRLLCLGLGFGVAFIYAGCSRAGDGASDTSRASTPPPTHQLVKPTPAENIQPASVRLQDVVYGRKFGLALTLDVFLPQQKSNGAAVLWIVSGGWFSSHESISLEISQSFIKELTTRGYTVFAVVHSSQPQFTIPEILKDIQRATRYVRFHAADYNIDPERIGITGASSGGHLALMQALAGDKGDVISKDPVERTSSRIQAVACFFAPTDFFNYGKPGEDALGRGLLKGYSAAFAFVKSNPTEARRIGAQISPVNHVSSDDPPTLLIHGAQDRLIPLQQSEVLLAKLKEVRVPAQLIVKKGAGHEWAAFSQDLPRIGEWFDTYLQKKQK
jgi:acetyl esterase/lipase